MVVERSIVGNVSQAEYDVLQERVRQESVEGWTPEHDDKHDAGELPCAAAAYAVASIPNAGQYLIKVAYDRYWPWHRSWWKPTTPRRNLVKAAALIIAEIERIDRYDQVMRHG